MRPGRPLLLATALLVLALPSGHVDTVDAGTRLLESRALLLERSVRIPAAWVRPEMGLTPSPLHPHPDGTFRSPYGIGLPLVWLPFVAAGWLAHRVTGFDLGLTAGAAVSYANVFILAALVAALWRLLESLGASRRERWISLAALLVGTNTLSFVSSCWSEPLAALCVLSGFGLATFAPDGPRAALAGACLSYGVLVKPELTLLLVPAAFLAWRMDRRAAPAFLFSSCVGPAILALSNWAVRGSPLRFEYRTVAFAPSSPLGGAVGTLFGETSLLLFDPALLLALAGWLARDLPAPLRRLRLPLALSWALLAALYTSKATWWGGLTFGPRFHYTLVPLTLLAIPSGLRPLSAALGARGAAAAGVLSTLLLLPLQVSGLSVRTNQAYEVVKVTGGPRWRAHLVLLGLKLVRGPAAPELYRKSDFVRLAAGEPDAVIDHRRFRTFQYLDHAPALWLASRLRERLPSQPEARR